LRPRQKIRRLGDLSRLPEARWRVRLQINQAGKLTLGDRIAPDFAAGTDSPLRAPFWYPTQGVTDMRKLLVSSFVSLDGIVEAPMTWASRFFDDEVRAFAQRKLDDVEFFLLGRKAYEYFAPVWPNATGSAYMDRINGLKKLVASTTLNAVGWNASLIKGDVAEGLAALKRQAGGHILKYGITALDRTLLDNNLVDEYDLLVLPTKVGEGKRAFADIDAEK
jgi:dihydrofolate reductase